MHSMMSSNDDVCVAMRARRLSRILTRAYDEALRELGLTVPQFTLLKATAAQEPVSPAEIGRSLDLEKSTLSRTLGKMIERGWLDEYRGEDGGKIIVATSFGRRTLKVALPVWSEVQSRAKQELGGQELEALDRMIDQAHQI
jgi:DNA-binding MarR family transcriptional regulator